MVLVVQQVETQHQIQDQVAVAGVLLPHLLMAETAVLELSLFGISRRPLLSLTLPEPR